MGWLVLNHSILIFGASVLTVLHTIVGVIFLGLMSDQHNTIMCTQALMSK
jgi:hypothetical protein